jgi:hypothetical protein
MKQLCSSFPTAFPGRVTELLEPICSTNGLAHLGVNRVNVEIMSRFLHRLQISLIAVHYDIEPTWKPTRLASTLFGLSLRDERARQHRK